MANNITPQPNPEEIRELLSPYLDGKVSDAQRARVEQAVAGSPELQEELESLRQTIALLSSLPPMPAPRPFTLTAADIGDVVKKQPGAPKKQSWFPFPAWAGGLAALLGALICVLAAGGLLFGTQFRGGAMVPAEIVLQQDSAAMLPTPTSSARMAAGAADGAEESVEAYSTTDEDVAASEAQPEPESPMVAPQEAPAVESLEMPAAEPVEEQAAAARQAIETEGRQEKAAAEQETAMVAVPEIQEAEDEALEESAAVEAAPPADDETALMAVPGSAPAGESETGRQLPPTPLPQPPATSSAADTATGTRPQAAETGADAATEAEVLTATPEIQTTSAALAAAPATNTPPSPPTAMSTAPPLATTTRPPLAPAGSSGWGSGVILMVGLVVLLLAGALIGLAFRRKQS